MKFNEWRETKISNEENLKPYVAKNLKQLKQDVEKNDKNKWDFEKLKENFKNNEAMKDLLDIFWDYVDFWLDKSFSKQEKETIKLALFWEIEQKFLNYLVIWQITEQDVEWLKTLTENLKNTENASDINLPKLMDDYKNEFEKLKDKLWKLWFWNILQGIDQKIKKLNKEKKNSTEIDSIDQVFWLIWSEKEWNLSKEQIIKNSKNLAKKLKEVRNLWTNIKKSIEKIPFWETIISWFRNIAKESPLLWFLFSLFFWKDFLNEKLDKQKKSLENLKKYAKKDKFMKNHFGDNQIKNLSLKKLEKFYKYLDSKNIDYSKENFWKEIFTWETKDKKIKQIYDLLKNKDWKILTSKDDWEDLIEKLNSLEELEIKKEQEEKENKLNQINQQIDKNNKDLNKLKEATTQVNKEIQQAKEQATNANNETKKIKAQQKLQEAKQKKAKLIEEAKKRVEQAKKLEAIKKEQQQEKDFIASVNNIKSLPAEINYKWENLQLNIDNNEIVLWEDKYKISIQTKFGEQFKKIEFKNWQFILNWNTDNPITKSQVVKLIKDLKDKWQFTYSWVVKKFWMDINYTLTISKI